MFEYQTGEELVNAIMRPLGTNLKNYEMVWKDKAIAVAAEVVSELATLRAQNEVLREALNQIAVWNDGPVVGSHFDEPVSAQTARNALAQVAS